MDKIIIVIPIYKATPDRDEKISFNQCLRILFKYPISIVTFPELDISYYTKLLTTRGVEYSILYFPQTSFVNLSTYNELMLSVDFYNKFKFYKYMLIYQLDCYVFRDELESWCNKGYDYIGAPWFTENNSHEEGGTLWAVGNGGFSLRKISTFRNLFNSTKNVYSLKYLLKKLKREKKNFLWFLRSYFFGYQNTFQYLVDDWNDAEDLFYCLKLADTNLKLTVPALDEAIEFAFEQSPSFLFQQNKNKLPFGCHAWNRYETESFWSRFIDLNSHEG